ncbi:hypothetical protein M407DRAFT_21491 [Tulasnella calospora MUT 4182]|uniref:Uncharacterized protein n=1 Tax=Tulasnella calospora MUT 4182 TaxID=1051891 RepID=A0A0C3QPU1_9AGAM|nr:hypothetical protein M407DRAFT_21491 [Tulasnella calospora MUT 4182]
MVASSPPTSTPSSAQDQAINTPDQTILGSHILYSLTGLETALPNEEFNCDGWPLSPTCAVPKSPASVLIESDHPLDNPKSSSLHILPYQPPGLQLTSHSPFIPTLPSSPSLPTSALIDHPPEPRPLRHTPKIDFAAFGLAREIGKSQGHAEILDGDLTRPVSPFRASGHQPQALRKSPDLDIGQWEDQDVLVSCPVGTGLRFIIESQNLPCLACGHAPNPLNSDHCNTFAVKISMPRHSATGAQSDIPDDAPAAARATRSSAKAEATTTKAPKRSIGRPTPKSMTQVAKHTQKATALPKAKASVKKVNVAKGPSNKKQDNHSAKPSTGREIADINTTDEEGPVGTVKAKGLKPHKSAAARRTDIDEPVPLPHSATSLKRKPGALRNSPGADEMELDNTSGDETPQPKKSRRSSASTKSVVVGKGHRKWALATVSRYVSSTVLNSPAMSSFDLPLATNTSSKGRKKTANGSQKATVIAAEKAVLQKQLDEAQAQLAARDAEVLRLQNLNAQVQKESRPHNQLIARPPGERGKNGWNLQKHMGLEGDYDTYSNIRLTPHQRCVRYAVYESQLNIWLRITRQDEMSLFTCYALVKKRFPFMGQFERNWATREFIKGICQNARKHCRRKGISDPTLPVELLDRDDRDDGEDGGGGNDDGADDEDDVVLDEACEDGQRGQNKNLASGSLGKSIKSKTTTKLSSHSAKDKDDEDDAHHEDEDEDDDDDDDEDKDDDEGEDEDEVNQDHRDDDNDVDEGDEDEGSGEDEDNEDNEEDEDDEDDE